MQMYKTIICNLKVTFTTETCIPATQLLGASGVFEDSTPASGVFFAPSHVFSEFQAELCKTEYASIATVLHLLMYFHIPH